MSNDEYCTPEFIIDFARNVMGGIDLDPASNKQAQKLIKAKKYYTKLQSGLNKKWRGNVWLNPPYSKGLINAFIKKTFKRSRYKSIMVLVNSSTDVGWYHRLLTEMTAMILFKGRINFILDGEEKNQNRVGQTLFLKTDSKNVLKKFCTQSFGFLIKL